MSSRSIILVPVDFSETSQRALDLAKEMSTKLGAEIVLLHVFEPPTLTYPELSPAVIESVYNEMRPAAERALDELAVRSGGLRALLREGNPGREIVQVAEELSPAFIVLGTHGRRGVQRLFFGSVAEHVLRRAPGPVVTVRGSSRA